MARHETDFVAEGPADGMAGSLAASLAGALADAPAPLPPRARADSARLTIRRRAAADAAALLALVAIAPLLADSMVDRLLVAVAAFGAAIVVYVARRGQDLERFARDARAREADIRSMGIPLSAWHGGAPLEPWDLRQRDAARRDA